LERKERDELSWYEKHKSRVLQQINRTNQVARSLRKVSVLTAAVAHGKLIGGGVALALIPTWRICSRGATFCVGNVPRGMNPLFMMSKSLPLLVGPSAFSIYAEDSIIPATLARCIGMGDSIAANVMDAKANAATFVRRSRGYLSASPIAQQCVDNASAAS